MSDEALVSLRARAERGIDSLCWLLNNAHNHNDERWAGLVEAAETDAADGKAAVAELVAALEAAERELGALKRQRWSNENRAEVAERGHKACLARDFEQRDEIKRLRAALEAAERDGQEGWRRAEAFLKSLDETQARLLAAQQALREAVRFAEAHGLTDATFWVRDARAALAAVGSDPAQEDKP